MADRQSRGSRRLALVAIMLGVGIAAAPGALLGVPPAPGPEGPPPGYALSPSFAEEFTGPAIDRQRWTHAYADPGARTTVAQRTLANNAERQVYFDPTFLGLGIDPFAIRDGVLTIRAEPLTAAARAAVTRDVDSLPAHPHILVLRAVSYSSGLISTRGRFAQRYGYFETRARWSAGKGLWPAFWMLPAGGGWPPEIDILEAHGDKPEVAFHSFHSKAAKTATKVAVTSDPQLFHRYGALWLPDRVDFYIDGNLTGSMPAPPDLDRPMYLIVNLAVGGKWPGDPTPDVKFPATLEVDYVRAWRLDRLPPPR
jgi:beta-glucanase (GH16 family)